MLAANGSSPAETVAIIGMAGRFPGADNVEKFWENLRNGTESIVTFTEDELRAGGIDETLRRLPGFVPRGCPIADVESFDAQFFGFSPRDAEVTDPQQRLFLECCHQALEDAGYDPEAYHGLIAVYGGSEMSTYMYQVFGHGATYLDAAMASIGNDKDYLATLVSYKLNLRGPSLMLGTACSTSLVTVCVAVQGLLSYQCDIALAGGVSVSVPQTRGYFYQPGGILSPDGHCRTFDAAGQGTVVGSGVGVVVLKRLSEAIADRDQILAVIKGVGLNNDGSLKVGFGAPSVEGQSQVIAAAQAMAGVHPDDITCIEAHGTATLLGDPIEMAALNHVFRAGTQRRRYCAIGSVKSNVGHLASAAGVAGLIKLVLALRHREIPPSLHFQKPNPQIDFDDSPFFVNTTLREWVDTGKAEPRRAGISSFGVGGTNAHAIIEESPPLPPTSASRPYQIVLVSAKTETALEAATDNLATHLERHPELCLPDVAFTTQVGRRPFTHRRMLLCEDGDIAEAARLIARRDPQRIRTGRADISERPLMFLFPGQGSQYVSMGRDLYACEEVFRQSVDLCAGILEPCLGQDVRDIVFAPPEHGPAATAALTRTALTQPALFTIEYALSQLLMSWGLVPQAMLGHSIGEYVAACVAGVLPLEQALALVACRGHLMDSMPPGHMMVVPLPEARVLQELNAELSLASVNGDSLCVVSGPAAAIQKLEARLTGRGLRGHRLQTSHAFHSSMMDPIVSSFVDAVRTCTLSAPQIPYLSNVTGTWITAEQATDPAYYGTQLRHTVRFGDSLHELAGIPGLVYLEVGPGQQLSTLVRQHPDRAGDQLVLTSMRGAHDTRSDVAGLLDTLGQLWLNGVAVSWQGFYASECRRRVSLPTYPFERQRYWVDPVGTPTTPSIEIGQRALSEWFYLPAWRPAIVATMSPALRRENVARRWLLCAPVTAWSSALERQLEHDGATVVAVRPGDRYRAKSAGEYEIRVGETTDWEALIRTLAAESLVPDVIVHGFSTGPAAAADGVAAFDDEQNRGFFSVLSLAQALERGGVTRRLELAVVTEGVQSITEAERLVPARATVLGACRVIPQECPNLRVRSIDVELEGTPAADVAEQIIREVAIERFEPTIGYRNRRRFAQGYDRIEYPPTAEHSRLRVGGVYLITGGLGKLGLTLADALARTVQARLVLVARSPMPPRETWDGWLASHPVDDPTSIRLQRLRAMEASGAEVLVIAADASDLDEMRQVLATTARRFGDLHGVIHAAGNVSADGFGSIGDVDRAMSERQFRPKAHGVLVLQELLRGRTLDFCMMVSSLSAVLGGLGLLPYAAANAYLDAVATRQSSEGAGAWISVNWDAWHFPEDVRHAPSRGAAVTPDAGADAFLRILAQGPRQVVVSVTDLEDRIKKWIRLEALHEPAGTAGKAVTHSRPNLSTEFVAARSDTEKKIAAIWEQVLGVAPVGIHDKFFDLGGHSLLAIELISQLRDVFHVDLEPKRLFEAPTIAQLAERIESDVSAARTVGDTRGQERLADILTMVENMSDEEVTRLLATADHGSHA
jgi:acyl transferase domain-containing protein/acyl carrier protein